MEDDRWQAVGLSVAITAFLAVVMVSSGLYQGAALAGLIGGFLAVTFAMFGTGTDEADETATGTASVADGAASTAAGERDRAAGAGSERAEALETLRERYARGELDDAEFEQRVERLLETESVERAEEVLGSTDGATGADEPASGEREPEYER